MVQLSLSSVNNNGLFAQHYLENRLPNMDEWEEPEDLEKTFEKIRELWEQEKDIVNNYNEAQLEENFIKKIFEILNHSYGVQATVRDNAVRPDYGFFKSSKEKKEAHKQKEIDDFYKNSIAVGDAKQWAISLDKKTKSGRVKYERSNPSWQIYMYLKETPANWGILTNGKKWRLYNEETSDRLDTYYEIDLPTILEKEDQEEALQEFKYFYLFFRQKAFTPTKKSFLDKIFEQSEKYSQRIGDNLEESVYEALLYMARGYFNNNENKLKPKKLRANRKPYSELDDEIKDKIKNNINEIRENSLVFLYRLLFLFYAESKDKLGRDVPKNYSFDNWVDNVLTDYDDNEIFDKGGTFNYRLRDIFKLLKKGSKGMGLDDQFFVPAYNGSLFEPEEHPFLKNKNIQDGYVAEVVNLLARDPLEKEEGRGRVDYSDLSIRHIGGIYEGLLEYKLEIAEKDIVAIKGEWKPIEKLDHDYNYYYDKYDNSDKHNVELDLAKEGEIYLATDKGERKATGSYYTPEYIVQYIVENTVKPKVEEKLEGLETDKEKREAILDINVLDPAMGSGHFLVDTLDLLANKLVKYAPEDVDEKEIDWAKRKVVRNCLYGVDINELATELAKLSLWLETMTEDKPLPFLDHHLRTGNSLIGANLKDLEAHPETDKIKQKSKSGNETENNEQVHLLDFVGKNEGENRESIDEKINEILKTQKEIMETTEDRPDDIKKEKKIYQRFRNNDLLLRLKMLADIYTSHYFGNKFTREQYEELKNSLTPKEWKEIAEQEWIKKYTNNLPKKYNKDDNLAKQKLFFHWKLEFPEVFFDIEEGTEKQDSGFDAVVGNPPYGYRGIPTDNEKYYLETNFETHEYNYENYVYFTELGVNLLSKKALQGYIIPNTFLSADKMEVFRKFLLKDNSLSELYYLGQGVFPGVTLESVIEIIDKRKSAEDVSVKISNDSRTENPAHSYKGDLNIFRENDNSVFDIELTPERREIVSKIRNEAVSLEDISYVTVGINTGYIRDEMTSEEKEDENHHKMLNGKNIGRYSVGWDGKWIIYDKEFVESFGDKGRTLPPERIFTEPKILLQRTRRGLKRKLVAYLDEDQYYNLNRVSNVVLEDENYSLYSILAMLNSKLLDRYFNWVFNEYEVKPSHLNKLPILDQEPSSVDFDLEEFYEDYSVEKFGGLPPADKVKLLADCSERIQELIDSKEDLSLNLEDFLGNYSDGKTLDDLYSPVEGLSDKVVSDTSADRDSLRIGSVEFEENGDDLVLRVSARYKPENPDEFDDLDRWGYTETELIPAMRFNVDGKLKALIKEFVPVAVDEAGGFANFRETATKTNSPIDRLEKLTLPKLEDVESGLEKFIENKEKAEKLEKEIQETDNQIDAIVFDLYDLTGEEIETVLDSLDTEQEVKKDIIQKFRAIKN